MTKKIVVIVDTQFDFMMKVGRLPVDGAEALIPDLITYVAALDPEEVEAVVFTFDTHALETFLGSPENLGNPEKGEPGFDIHCEKGTPGWENVINPTLVPNGIRVFTLEKGVFDMWAEPDLYLHTFNPAFRVDREKFFSNPSVPVEVVGVAADFCHRDAVLGFVKRGFNVTVPRNLTKGIIRQIEQIVAEDYPVGAVTIV
jgi:nicotinamidase/pyrazinamidase